MKNFIKNCYSSMQQKLCSFGSTPGYTTLLNVSNQHKKTFLDGSFQRYAGHEFASGWSLKEMQEYIICLLSGKVCNDIVRVDLDLAYHWNKSVPKGCKESADYYKKLLDAGFEYLSVDGNNTSSAVTNFMDNKFPIFDTGTNEEVWWKDLDEDEKLTFKMQPMSIITISQITRKQVHDLFIKLQKGTRLNPQEIRNAYCTPLSRYIRNSANTVKVDDSSKKRGLGDVKDSAYPSGTPFFNNVMYPNKTSDALEVRRHEQFVATVINKIESDYSANIGKAALDKLYLQDDLRESTKKSFETISRVLDSISPDASLSKPISSALHGGNSIFTFVDLIDMVVNKYKYDIVDAEKFLEKFTEWESKKVEEAEALTNTPEDREKSYIWKAKYSTLPDNYNVVRKMMEVEILEDSSTIDKWVAEGVIKKRRTQKDSFSMRQGVRAACKQNFETRKGEKFSIGDVLSNRVVKDHMRSVKDNGKTEISNCELMYPEDNFKKGPKSNKPHFDYQK